MKVGDGKLEKLRIPKESQIYTDYMSLNVLFFNKQFIILILHIIYKINILHLM